jgi:hypothetical protein
VRDGVGPALVADAVPAAVADALLSAGAEELDAVGIRPSTVVSVPSLRVLTNFATVGALDEAEAVSDSTGLFRQPLMYCVH